jgi:hypothetical protein
MWLATLADRRLSSSHCGAVVSENVRAATLPEIGGEAEMTPMPGIDIARTLSTAELDALSVLREIRESGAFVLIDVDSCMYIYHVAPIPDALKSRLLAYRYEAATLLLEYIQ